MENKPPRFAPDTMYNPGKPTDKELNGKNVQEELAKAKARITVEKGERPPEQPPLTKEELYGNTTEQDNETLDKTIGYPTQNQEATIKALEKDVLDVHVTEREEALREMDVEIKRISDGNDNVYNMLRATFKKLKSQGIKNDKIIEYLERKKNEALKIIEQTNREIGEIPEEDIDQLIGNIGK